MPTPRLSFIQFKEHFAQFGVFSLRDIRKVYPNFSRRRLSEWQEKSYIKKITNKWYFFCEKNDQNLNEQFKFLISNRIYAYSYVSLESALSFYGLIPEGVFTITSVSTLKTKNFNTEIGSFDYNSISPHLYFGYKVLPYKSWSILIAEPEKALIDFLYLRSNLKTKEDFAELRLNKSVYQSIIDVSELNNYLKFINIKSMTTKFNILTESLNAKS